MANRLGLTTLVVAIVAVLFVAAPPEAQANPRYAAYVVHADTGDVLFDRYSNDRRYPASLTKMMTLYLLFEEIEAGQIALDDKFDVSRRAALQPASKLGVTAGSTIEVSTAIDALVIKSANDVATVVAENLAGSESAFAARMTERARSLGMRSTTFRNASGLPNSRQVTTARDMAVLSQRLIQDFPQFFERFQKRSFEWRGRTYRSHNRVMLSLDGADGMKTGYTRASGYNLSTTTERDGHRLIGIVLGGRSTATRDRHMKDIINAAYVDIERRPDMINPIYAAAPSPNLKPGLTAPVMALAAAAPEDAGPVHDDAVAPSPSLAGDLNLESLRVAVATVANDTGAVDEAAFGQGDAEPDTRRDWLIQVGAYSRQPLAVARIRQIQNEIFAIQPAVGREVNIAQRGGEAVYRARFTQLTAFEAEQACAALKNEGQDCLALRTGTQ